MHRGLRLVCKLCNDRFRAYNGLIDHVKSKYEKVGYKCNECDAALSSKSILKRHIL
jgi:hypothetical protein